ncbi:MAG: M81 family metallopeptidase [Geminicoccaceae bacterium]|nr:M81 family metallopeptidase [Geminicoccaceae bacterium]
MTKILLAECTQEVSSFNPLPSTLADFTILHGAELLGRRGTNSYLGGALAVFDAAPGIELVPVTSATAPSAGTLEAASWRALRGELLERIEAAAPGVDGVYLSLHGAMVAEAELDPEGELLDAVRAIVGPHVPIVVSLDLHGIFTRRMMRAIDGFTVLKTYPHTDFADTGARAARLLLRILGEGLRPAFLRVAIPALVRGDELVTKTGCYGDRLLEIGRLEREGRILAGGLFIGNPFTDVPELGCQVVFCYAADPAPLEAEAVRIAQRFRRDRGRMQAKLWPLDDAVAQALALDGPVALTDAADATSSGATGDSNAIVKALVAAGCTRRVLAPIVDAPAAAACHAAGCGATLTLALGGSRDPARFGPLELTGTVRSLSTGKARLETMKVPIEAGPCAVFDAPPFTLLILSAPAFLFDRALFFANGLDPRDFDIVVVKSPHCEPHMFDAWVVKNLNVDAPGSTSANLASLGHRLCPRPIFPLDPDTVFTPRVETIRRP